MGARVAGSLVLAGGLVFFVVNTIAEASYPGYSVKTNALSDLGALGAPTRLLWDGQLVVAGLLGLVGMYVLFFRGGWEPVNGGVPRSASPLYLLPSVGTIIVAIFPENFVAGIHILGALLFFIVGGIAAVYAYRLTAAPFRYFSVALGLIALVSTFSLGVAGPLGFGLVERMVVYPISLWEIAFGGYLMSF